MVEENRRISDAHFIAQEDLEWLSLNYRKERAARLSKSRRRMILIMFQRDISYFPSLKEIRDELIMAQMDLIKQESRYWNNKTKFERLQDHYSYNWELLFKLGSLGHPIEKPLTQKILSDSTHEITKLILYLYSMESFIYPDLNKACRNKNPQAIKFYGAFSAALSFIIDNANKKNGRKNPKKHTKLLFRGLKMTPEEADGY